MAATGMFSEQQLKTAVIGKIRTSVRINVSRENLMSMTVEKMEDYLARDVAYQFDLYLSGKEHKSKYKEVISTIEVPNSWWQHFKKDYFPQWLLNRFPVKSTIYNETVNNIVTITKICPHLMTDSEREHVTYLINEPKKAEFKYAATA